MATEMVTIRWKVSGKIQTAPESWLEVFAGEVELVSDTDGKTTNKGAKNG